MKEIIKLSAFAEGYYSGQTYNESVYIYKDSYDKLDKPIELYIYELDGKHSEVKVDIEVEVITNEEELLSAVNSDEGDDGSELEDKIIYNENTDRDTIKKEIEEIQAIINSLDYDISETITLKKSQMPLLKEFLEKLKNS